MIDSEVYLEKLNLFGKLLRNEGLNVSPKENADAARTLSVVGFSDRDTVKTALKTVYAKSQDEQKKFDKVFDSFFISEDVIRALDKKHQEKELEEAEALKSAQEALSRQSPNHEYTKEEAEAYAKLSEDEKNRLEALQKRIAQNSTDRSEKLYAEFIHSVFMKSILEQQIKMEDAALGAQALDPELGLYFKEISAFQDSEIPKAVSYIQDLSRQINGELSQKRNKSGKSSALDFRKTIRKSLESGGNFYHLKYKKKRQRRKKLVLLCDVSGSMIQFSEFALRLIQSLSVTAESSRVILFSEESMEADAFHLQNMDLFRGYVRESNLYGKGTNLGEALKKLNDERPSALGPSTVLIILSDAKSVDMQTVLEQLDRSRSRAGKVYCLNPIAQSKWKFSDSIMMASEKCTMLPCSSLSELGKACRQIV